jgi:hypothetical protein
MESLERLRAIVSDSIGKHMYANAVFFADKLVSMTNGVCARAWLSGRGVQRASVRPRGD